VDLKQYLNKKTVITILCLAYLAGIIGLNYPNTAYLFKLLTPFHLLLTTIILLVYHVQEPNTIGKVFLISFTFGFFIEVIGVKTGVIFGQYTYGNTLGIKVLEVPLTIGLNWFVLNYLFIFLIKNNKLFSPKNNIFMAILVATGMTLLDYFIEPVAIKHDFWSWQQAKVPLRNYLGWWVGGFILTLFNLPLLKIFSNNLALIVLLLQAIFFLSQNTNFFQFSY
jgi:bisanhydrobacterioruberin hydratase